MKQFGVSGGVFRVVPFFDESQPPRNLFRSRESQFLVPSPLGDSVAIVILSRRRRISPSQVVETARCFAALSMTLPRLCSLRHSLLRERVRVRGVMEVTSMKRILTLSLLSALFAWLMFGAQFAVAVEKSAKLAPWNDSRCSSRSNSSNRSSSFRKGNENEIQHRANPNHSRRRPADAAGSKGTAQCPDSRQTG